MWLELRWFGAWHVTIETLRRQRRLITPAAIWLSSAATMHRRPVRRLMRGHRLLAIVIGRHFGWKRRCKARWLLAHGRCRGLAISGRVIVAVLRCPIARGRVRILCWRRSAIVIVVMGKTALVRRSRGVQRIAVVVSG